MPLWNFYQSSQWEGTKNTIEYSLKDTKERDGPDKSDGEEQSQDISENKYIFKNLWKQKEGVLECEVRIAILGQASFKSSGKWISFKYQQYEIIVFKSHTKFLRKMRLRIASLWTMKAHQTDMSTKKMKTTGY